MIVLYVVPDCPLCENVRVWFNQRNVQYVERDVAKDFGALRAMYKLTRQNLVPVVQMNDRAIVRPTHGELQQLFSPGQKP